MARAGSSPRAPRSRLESIALQAHRAGRERFSAGTVLHCKIKPAEGERQPTRDGLTEPTPWGIGFSRQSRAGAGREESASAAAAAASSSLPRPREVESGGGSKAGI